MQIEIEVSNWTNKRVKAPKRLESPFLQFYAFYNVDANKFLLNCYDCGLIFVDDIQLCKSSHKIDLRTKWRTHKKCFSFSLSRSHGTQCLTWCALVAFALVMWWWFETASICTREIEINIIFDFFYHRFGQWKPEKKRTIQNNTWKIIQPTRNQATHVLWHYNIVYEKQ